MPHMNIHKDFPAISLDTNFAEKETRHGQCVCFCATSQIFTSHKFKEVRTKFSYDKRVTIHNTKPENRS